jgi:hypothetical protein
VAIVVVGFTEAAWKRCDIPCLDISFLVIFVGMDLTVTVESRYNPASLRLTPNWDELG